MEKKSVTVQVASWSAAHPWRAIIGWLVFVAVCLGAGSLIGTNNATTEDYRVGEAGHAEAMAAQGGLQRQPVEQVVIDSPSGTLDQAAAQAAAQDVTDRMRKLPEVQKVDPAVLSADGKVLVVAVTMNGEELAARKHVDPLVAQTAATQAAHPALRIAETGRPSMSKGLDAQRGDDLALSEAITLPVTLITLLIAFGSVLAAGVPVLLALSSIGAAMGLAQIASHALPDAGVGNNIILLIGMAVGVDYSLFYLKREREERVRAGGALSPQAIVELAAATSGRAIMVSGFAVLVSTACLYFATDVIFASLATGTVLVVLVAMASSVTVLPALLAKLGQGAEKRAAAKAAKGKPVSVRSQKAGPGKVWTALLKPAGKHPVITLVVATVIMLGLASPALGLKLSVLGSDTFSREIPAVQTYDRLTGAFPDLRVQHQIVVTTDAARTDEVVAALQAAGRLAAADPLFAHDQAPQIRTSADGRVSSMTLSAPLKPSSDASQQSLRDIRSDFLPATVGRIPGADVAVTGDIARDADYLRHQDSKLPLVIGLLLLLTFLITVLAFGSVVIAVVGVLLNLLSAAAAFGLLVVVFQGQWAQGLLGFTSTGSIGSRVPLFLFVILFGLSMDYQVFVISRIREAALKGVPTRKAVLDGIGNSASVVTSAAVVMVTVFASFIFLNLVEMKEMGFSLAVAVLLDAFIVRIMILPSVLTLLGKFAWWPSKGMRRAQTQPPSEFPQRSTASAGRARLL